MNITEPSSRLTCWRLRLDEYDLHIRYKKITDDGHDDTLYRLLTIAITESIYCDDIITSVMEAELGQQTDDEYSYPAEYFSEEYYDQLNRLIDTEPKKPRDRHLTQINLDELISAKLHDLFCSDTHQMIHAENPPFRTYDNQLLVRNANPDPQVVVPHTL